MPISNTLISLLNKLGLTAQESRLYLAALELGVASVQQIATKARIHRVAAYPYIESLRAKGLLEGEPKTYGKKIVAASPRRLVGMSVDMEESHHRLTQDIESRLPEFLALYQSQGKPRVRLMEGVEGFRTLMQEVEDTHAPYDHLGGSEAPLLNAVGHKAVEAWVRRKDALGMKRRVLVAEDAWTKGQVRSAPQGLRTYRFLAADVDVSTRLYLFGTHSVAFVSFGPTLIVLIVEDVHIHRLQQLFFNALWAQSRAP